jgi:hypothetical protein
MAQRPIDGPMTSAYPISSRGLPARPAGSAAPTSGRISIGSKRPGAERPALLMADKGWRRLLPVPCVEPYI